MIRKKLRLLMMTALATMTTFSTVAVAETGNGGTSLPERVSANGKYEFKPSWGIGIQYGVTFTDLDNWNRNLLIPGATNTYDVDVLVNHELYGEWSPVEGFRMSIFGGYQSLYIKETGFSYYYGGIEPAWAARRSFYELAVGLGVGYGGSTVDTNHGDMNGHGLMLRPFVEARFYPSEIFAIYLRLAFQYYKEFGLEANDWVKSADVNGSVDTDDLHYAGPNVSIGVRFGSFPAPVCAIGDQDGDGVLDDVDACNDVRGEAAYYGCPNPDVDGDGYCDAWVAQKGLQKDFEPVCIGSDKCPNDAEDADGFEDEDGCPEPDNDKDGICDPWVSELGMAEKYADLCKGADKCANEAEDYDDVTDEDGCPDPDNDKDGFCDPWVAEQGLAEKYANVCHDKDFCPYKGDLDPNLYGCGDPDGDQDGYCEAWVYENKLEGLFPKCLGMDRCPDEKGSAPRGCIPRRVEVTEAAIEIHDTINFDVNKATIKKNSDSLLNEIAEVFKQNPQIKKVSIEGHTELSGNAKKNQTLSENRAKAVMDRLIKLGVEPERMTYAGFGSSRPVEPLAKGQKKETKAQAAKNRRVEFNIVEQEQVKKKMTVQEARAAGYQKDQVQALDKNGNPIEKK